MQLEPGGFLNVRAPFRLRLCCLAYLSSGSLIPSPEEAQGSRHKFDKALGICRRWRLRRTGSERGRESEPEGRSAPERSTKNSAPLLLEHSLSSSSRCASRPALVLAARLAHSTLARSLHHHCARGSFIRLSTWWGCSGGAATPELALSRDVVQVRVSQRRVARWHVEQ